MKAKCIDIESVVKDIKTVIKKEGKDELRYDLPDDNELVIQVLAYADETLEISVERLDEDGNTVESSTDDYDCDDNVLWAMIENAVV